MSLIKLPFSLTDPDPRLLQVTDFDAVIGAIPSLVSWHSARPAFATVDGSNLIASISARAGAGELAVGNDTIKPVYGLGEGPNGFDRAAFASDGLVWGGAWPTTAYTKVVAFKVDPDTTKTVQTLFGNNVSGAKHRIYLRPIDGNPVVRHQIENTSLGSGATLDIATSGLTTGGWHVAFASFDGATGKARVAIDDGSTTETTVGILAEVASNSVYLGCSGITLGVADNPFDGDVSDVMVFSADLFAAENAADLANVRSYLRGILDITA